MNSRQDAHGDVDASSSCSNGEPITPMSYPSLGSTPAMTNKDLVPSVIKSMVCFVPHHQPRLASVNRVNSTESEASSTSRDVIE